MKVNSAYDPSDPDQVGAYPGFFSMKQLGVLLLPLNGMLVHTAVARLRGTVRVKCLAQEHNIISQPGIIPGLLDLETSALGMRPIVPTTTDNVKDSKRHNCNEVIQNTWNNAPML